jgi:hypothetical protein
MAPEESFGCYYRRNEADTMIDRGTFLSMTGDGRPMAREIFALSRTAEGHYRAVANHEAADGSYAFEAAWDYDAFFNPLGARGTFRQAGRTWRASIEPHEREAMLRHDDGESSVVHRLEYRHGWMMDLDPSAVPLSIMMRRYDRRAGGEQKFRWIGYAGTKGHAFLDDIVVTLAHRGTVEVPLDEAGGGVRRLDAFEAEEILVGLEGPGVVSKAQVRLWTDADAALRRFVFESPRRRVTQWREGEESLADYLK